MALACRPGPGRRTHAGRHGRDSRRPGDVGDASGAIRCWLRPGWTLVGGWRPSTSARPAGLILVEDDEPVAVANLALANQYHQNLFDLRRKFADLSQKRW